MKSITKKIKYYTFDCSEDFTQRNFALSEYKDSTGRSLPMFTLTRDAFTILAMGFTGKTAAQWKEKFGKQHYNVIRDIQSLDCSEEFKRLNFQPLKREYRGQEFTYYEITRDGFTFLAMGFTGLKAIDEVVTQVLLILSIKLILTLLIGKSKQA